MQERCAEAPTVDDGSSARRHNQALVALARQCWTGRQSLEWALARICETSAEVLEVDRVNVWRLHPAHGVLRCIHAYDRRSGEHNYPGYDEALDADSEYGRRLDQVRVIDAADVHRDPGLSTLRAYFGRHQARPCSTRRSAARARWWAWSATSRSATRAPGARPSRPSPPASATTWRW